MVARHGIEEEPALQDALAYFVESGAGVWHERFAEPLRYEKKRRYIRDLDISVRIPFKMNNNIFMTVYNVVHPTRIDGFYLMVFFQKLLVGFFFEVLMTHWRVSSCLH